MNNASNVAATLATATESAPTLRDATPSDAADLALALARQLNREIRTLVDSDDSDDSDPFALATRGREEIQRKKRLLLNGLNGLKAAHARYTAVFEAWQTACAELAEANEQAAHATGVQMHEIARSLGIRVVAPSGNAPISDMARERAERQRAEREIEAKIAEAKQEAKAEIEAAREARKQRIEAAKAARAALKLNANK